MAKRLRHRLGPLDVARAKPTAKPYRLVGSVLAFDESLHALTLLTSIIQISSAIENHQGRRF
ncbi:MAG: hypothetical protein ABIO63_11180, partial [Casimicrobiaceae bacterium]